MAFVFAVPDGVSKAAKDLAGIGSNLAEANSAAAGQTTEMPAPAADAVSGLVAVFLNAHAQDYQAIGAQAADFHQQFVQALTADADAYAGMEAGNAATLGNP